MKKYVIAAMLATLVAGCSSGGSSGPASLPPGTTVQVGPQMALPVSNPAGSALVTATATVPANAVLPYDVSVAAGTSTSGKARRALSLGADRTLAGLRRTLAISTVEVDGNIFQGTASSTFVHNTVTLTPGANGLAVSLPFSNVVASKNSWIVLNFYANAADGSQYYIGCLGGIVNVSASGTSVVIDNASTLRLSALLAGLSIGAVSSYDLENTPTLDADLGTFIAAKGYTPDPATLFYSAATRQQIQNDLAAKYARTLTVTTGSSNPATVSIVYDFNQTDENNLIDNLIGSPQLAATTVAAGTSAVAGKLPGAATYANNADLYITNHSPSVNAGANGFAGTVTAYYLPAPTGTVTTPVYGGHIIVGAHVLTTQLNDATTQLQTGQLNVTEPYPFVGGNAVLAGRAPGSAPTAVAITMASTAITATQIDPQRNAFSPSPAVSATVQPLPTQTFTTSTATTSGYTLPSYNSVLGNNGTITSPSYPNPAGTQITATIGGPSNVPPGLPPLTGTGITPLYYISLVSAANTAFNSGTTMNFNIFNTNVAVPLPCGNNYYLAGYDSSRAASGWFLQILGPKSACPSTGSANVSFTWSQQPNVTLTSGVQYGLVLYAQAYPSPSPSALPLLASLGTATLTTAPLNSAGGPTFAQTCNGFPSLYCYQSSYTSTSGGGLILGQTYSPPNVVPSLVTTGTTAMLDLWNPFNIPASALYACGFVAQCGQVTNGGTFTAYGTFFDPGSNLGYYNWTPSGSTTAIAPRVCFAPGSVTATACGYALSYSGLSGGFSSTTQSLFTQNLQVVVNSTAPLGTVWTVTMTDTNGNSYTSSATASYAPFGNTSQTTAYINMSSIAALSVKSASIAFSYQLPAGTTAPGTFNIFGL